MSKISLQRFTNLCKREVRCAYCGEAILAQIKSLQWRRSSVVGSGVPKIRSHFGSRCEMLSGQDAGGTHMAN